VTDFPDVVTGGDRFMSAIVRYRFYPAIALALALFSILGFWRTYYLRSFTDLPPLTLLVQLHGAAFTAWLVLFVVQTRLVAAHRVDLHMKLGITGVVIACLIVAVGLATVAAKAALPRIHPSGLTPPQFTIVGLMSLSLFATFAGLGIAYRRRPSAHKRFMVLAMIAVLTPPASRILSMLGLRENWTLLTPILPAVFIVWCLVHDWRQHGKVHPVFAVGGAVIALAWPLRFVIGRSEWYQPVGEWFARVGAGL
jgi:hypothetical protein